MLIKEKLMNMDHLTTNEKTVGEYILENMNCLSNLSTKTIANNTYTSPSTTVRLAKKLGYSGWVDLKEALIVETEYLESHFEKINPNFPFGESDSIQEISNKIASLLSDAIFDTAKLIHHDELQKSIKYLYEANTIYIFAITNSASMAYDFQYKMRFLSNNVIIQKSLNSFLNMLGKMTAVFLFLILVKPSISMALLII